MSFQCIECSEGFLGEPIGGHQCYRQMSVNRDYCLDPDTQMSCNRGPEPLLAGRTVFFAVQPKYLNVDIRITIDVTQGGTWRGESILTNHLAFLARHNNYTMYTSYEVNHLIISKGTTCMHFLSLITNTWTRDLYNAFWVRLAQTLLIVSCTKARVRRESKAVH